MSDDASTAVRDSARAAAFLGARRGPILAEAQQSLCARSRRYSGRGPAEVRSRLDALFDRLVASLAAGDFTRVVAHARLVARTRYETGYDLADVQAAFNALEEAVWSTVFAEDDLVLGGAVLRYVSAALGTAKDALACEYVGLAERTGAPPLDLAALSRGVERP
ncbi:MAG TPA: hypothetical protein VHC67_16185 [Gaiellaceae bacterium]|jgi:hypothetical protein|nr:hypothetical protein [Gaiellaceae bacterium]